jgi:hypothetical protein
VRAEDQFHPGVVVDEPVLLAGGEIMLPPRFAYSASIPRMELVQSVPGTPWVPLARSGAHHVG